MFLCIAYKYFIVILPENSGGNMPMQNLRATSEYHPFKYTKRLNMNTKERHHQIDYIEFGATDLSKIKRFYGQVFGWEFTDYGPDYTSFSGGQLAGGFAKGGEAGGHPLVVLYSTNLERTFVRLKEAGGTIEKEIFSFPGGRRFHFKDPSGNELAVWSE